MTTMDFFGHQERARAASRRLVLWFALAVVCIVVSIYLAALATLQFTDTGTSGWWHTDLFVAIAGVTATVVALGSIAKIAQLRSGGRKVAELLGGRAVDPDTRDDKERMLRNVVEEMAIASGTPVPGVYVLDEESAINAFAAGWGSADAVVAVTRGCLEQLDRDELQGVIAHEFSHVFHGDMRLNIRMMGVLFGIVCIATIGRVVVRTVGRSGGGGGNKKGGAAGIVLFGLALMLIGWLGVLLARLIQAAVSRQREFLADASAVQYTRNPRGIGMALAKIGKLGAPLRSAQTESASHMLFADGMKRYFGGALATHPPIAERVERILPGFRRQLTRTKSMPEAVAATPEPALAAGPALVAAVSPAAPRIDGRRLVATAGTVGHREVEAARAILHEIPLELAAAARDPLRAQSLVLALLLPTAAHERRKLLQETLAREPALAHEATLLFAPLAAASRHLRLPLVELAIGALRALPPDALRALRADARRLALADGDLSPFEFALLRTLERHLRLPGELPPRPPGRPAALPQHPREVVVVLSALARVGARGDEAAARAAFGRGVDTLAVGIAVDYLPRESAGIAELDAAVTAMLRVSPLGKRNLLLACAEVAGADGSLDADEADLLRALAELWDCPIPLVTGPGGAPLAAVSA